MTTENDTIAREVVADFVKSVAKLSEAVENINRALKGEPLMVEDK
jgi:hypothetical protein